MIYRDKSYLVLLYPVLHYQDDRPAVLQGVLSSPPEEIDTSDKIYRDKAYLVLLYPVLRYQDVLPAVLQGVLFSLPVLWLVII